MRAEALEVLDTDARIPYVRRRGDYLYNFWRDAENPRGLWRRTTLDSYRTDAPDWEVVIDIDELAAPTTRTGCGPAPRCIEPDHSSGADQPVARRLGCRGRARVRHAHKRIRRPAASSCPRPRRRSPGRTRTPCCVGTDFGEDSLTDSGYPRLVKRWRRGTPLDDAETLFSGASTDVIVAASADRTPGFERTILSRAVDFFNDEVYELRDGEFVRIDAPTDAKVSVHRNWLLIELRTDWDIGADTFAAGSLLAAEYDKFLAGTADLHVVFEPDEHTSLHHYAWTRDKLIVVTLADVASRVEVVTPQTWTATAVPGIPENTNTIVVDTDDLGDEIFVDSSGFDTPSRLLRGPAEGPLEEIKSAPAFFDAENITVTQHFATSKDGTAIPYFVVGQRDSERPAPTLLGGYGGFEVSRTPGYDGVLGRLWLSRGGTYVLANIRGGGEYGPSWHTQTMREGRHLVARGLRRGRKGFGGARNHQRRAARGRRAAATAAS